MFSRAWFRPSFVLWVVAIGFSIVLFKWQISLLNSEIEYSYPKYSRRIFSINTHHQNYPHWEDMRKLGKVLPPMYPIAPPYPMFGYFHKQDLIWTNLIPVAHIWPRMIVFNESNIGQSDPHKAIQNPDSLVAEKLTYYFVPEDRHYLIEAGITPK
tara:strand:- start:36 stop:500 length:465 start_codon:yes stop_codon:yes gene_type:complete